MPEYLGNFPKAWVSEKFPRYPGIWEIPIFDIFYNCCNNCYRVYPPQDIPAVKYIQHKISLQSISTTRYPSKVYPPQRYPCKVYSPQDIPVKYIHHKIALQRISNTRYPCKVYPCRVYPPQDSPIENIQHKIYLQAVKYIPVEFSHHKISLQNISTTRYPYRSLFCGVSIMLNI